MNLRKKMLVLATLLLCTIMSRAQAPVVSYPVVAQNLTQSYGSSLLTVKVAFTNACTNPTTVKVSFPDDISYVAGSVSVTSGNLNISEGNISNLRKPEFTIVGNQQAGSNLTFTIARKANCTNLTLAKDTVEVLSCGNIIENSSLNTYNIVSPAFSVAPIASITNATVGASYNRNIVLSNGGTGVTDTVRFYVVYPQGFLQSASATNEILANGVPFVPYWINGDTLFYKIFGTTIFNGDNQFANNEQLTIVEQVKLVQCSPQFNVTNFGFSWGNFSQNCNTITASSNISTIIGAANFTVLGGSRINYVNLCNPFDFNITMTNGGQGNANAATMYNISVLQGTGVSQLPAVFDTVLYRLSDVRINGNPVSFTWENGAKMRVNLENVFTFDPDGAGVGLEDMDGDGFYDDLPPGRTLTFTIKFTPKPVPCNRNRTFYFQNVQLSYDDMCGNSAVSVARYINSIMYIHQQEYSGTAYVPATIQSGVPFNFKAAAGYYSNTNTFRTINSRYRWKIVLPPDVTIAAIPNAMYGTTPVPATNYTLVNDTIIYTTPNSTTTLQNFSINLVFNCGASGTKTFYYTLEDVNDIVTGCTMWANLLCANISANAICPIVCNTGPTTKQPVARRANGSLGWTNSNMTTRQSASNVSPYDLSRALYMDTIEIHGSAIQNNNANNLHLSFSLPKTTIAPLNTNKLLGINTNVKVYRNGSMINDWTGAVFNTTQSTTTLQTFKWDLTGGLPTGGLLAGDSVVVVSRYYVNTNLGLPQYDVQSGGAWYFYNLNGSTEVLCNQLIPEMYLIGTYLLNGTNPFVTSGCASNTLGGNTWNLARRFNSSGQYFLNEFRPSFFIDSIVIDVPNEYQLNEVALDFSGIPNTSIMIPSSTILTPNIINGTKRTYINPGTWRTPHVTVTNTYGTNVILNVTANCATTDGVTTNVKVYIRDYYYAYATGATPVPAPAGLSYILFNGAAEMVTGQTRAISHTKVGAPTVELQDLSGIVQMNGQTQTWNVSLSNPSINTAPYTWIAIPDHPEISIVQVRQGATVFAPVNYPGGKMYHLSTAGINSGASANYQIEFAYSECQLDSIPVYAGWNCGAFPSSLAAYPCDVDSIYLKVSSGSSQVQLSVLQQPGNGSPIDLCTIDSTVLIVSSTEAANLVNPYITFYPPTGVSLQGNVRVEYPLGSGNYQNAIVVPLTGGGYQINLNGHTTIASTGILGTAIANPNFVPIGGDREARVVIPFITNCDLLVGTGLNFSAYGAHPCGLTTNGNGVVVTTNGIFINGAGQLGSATLDYNMGANTILGCDGLTLNLSATSILEPTQNGDTIVYSIPSSMTYNGNFTSVLPGFNAITSTGTNGETLVKIAVPAGIPANTPFNFGFNIGTTLSCSDTTISATYYRQVGPFTCGTTLCSFVTVALVTQVSGMISVEKPTLQITSVNYAQPVVMNTPVAYGITVVNTSATQSALANDYIVEFFCNGQTTPYASAPFNSPIPASGIANATISVPYAACITDGPVTLRIRPITANNIEQCLCDSTSIIILPPCTDTAYTLNDTICQGQTYTFNNTSYTTSQSNLIGNFFTVEGCDSIVTLNLYVTPAPTSILDTTICQGKSVTFGPNVYTTNQTGIVHTFSTLAGCDSIVTLNLTVTPAPTSILDTTICQGQSLTFGNTVYTTNQTGVVHTFSTLAGCDSIVTLNLTVSPYLTGVFDTSICQDQHIIFNGNAYYTSIPSSLGITDTIPTLNGCDSIVTLNLTIVNTNPQSIVTVLEDCEVVNINGHNYYNDTILIDTLYSQLGCDSIYNVTNVNIHNIIPQQLSIDTFACYELYFHGNLYTSNGYYSDTLRTSLGCDSVYRQYNIYINTFDLTLSIDPEDPFKLEPFKLIADDAEGHFFNVLSWQPSSYFPNQSLKVQNLKLGNAERIIVTAVSSDGCIDTASIEIDPKDYSKDIFIPSAFSPNGDGLNDVFTPKSSLGRAFSMEVFRVYNRYGQIVHSTANSGGGWDGTFNGRPLDAGVYFYQIHIRFFDGSLEKFQGDITLIR